MKMFRVISLFIVLGMLVSVASAEGQIQLPKKIQLAGHFYRSGIAEERSDLQTPERFFAAAAAAAGKRPVGKNILVNRDFNFRPQNETSIAIDPHNDKHIVTGYNDYRLGWPIGGGFSTTFDGGKTWHDGTITFPSLIAPADFPGFAEPPAGTGDPAVVIDNSGRAWHSTLGFSASFCENGLFAHYSPDGGKRWIRPVVNATGSGGSYVIDYWPYAFDCSVGLDKEYMAIDNTGGAHDGRLYVTYTRFLLDSDGSGYYESPIYLAYSDDGGYTWNHVGEINGNSATLCEYQADTTGGSGPGATGPDVTPYDCDENHFSYPVVGSDGTLYVHFFNEQNESEWTAPGNFNDQILVVKVDPNTFAINGPHLVTGSLSDGLNNYPYSPFNSRQTVCNGGWRINAAGNIDVGPADELYIVFADNRNGDIFPYPTYVSGTDGSCPSGLHTSTDVFITKSVDGGETWSPPRKITQDAWDFDNWFPRVAISDNGWVWVVYYDRRVSGDNTLTDAWIALSKDGGNSWREDRASSTSSDFFYGFLGSPSFMGDYNGIVAKGHFAYPFWTDARTLGDTDVYLQIADGNPKLKIRLR